MRQPLASTTACVTCTKIMPPATLPEKAMPVARPFFSLNQLLSSAPQGTSETPLMPMPTSTETR